MMSPVRYPCRTTRLQQLRDQARPAGLVRRAHAAPRVAVEILEEQQVVAEVRIVLQLRAAAEDRPLSRRVGQEDAREP
jgi:hypothetical protein